MVFQVLEFRDRPQLGISGPKHLELGSCRTSSHRPDVVRQVFDFIDEPSCSIRASSAQKRSVATDQADSSRYLTLLVVGAFFNIIGNSSSSISILHEFSREMYLLNAYSRRTSDVCTLLEAFRSSCKLLDETMGDQGYCGHGG